MKLGVNDVRTRCYKATEWILNVCINWANYANQGFTKHSGAILAERP